VPRWLILVATAAALVLTLALLRYAIDLLGVVFIIVLVGFSIRALTDWLTDRDAVSMGSIAAVFVGLFGTMAVGMWLFGSSASRAAGRLEQRMPLSMLTAIEWAESQGWGKRVLLATPFDTASAPAQPRTSRREPGTPRSSVESRTPRSSRGSRSGGVEQRSHVRADRAETPSTPPAATPTPSQPYATSTTLTVSPAGEVPVGLSVRLTADVESDTSRAPLPEGIVIFWRDTVVLGSVPLRKVGNRSLAQLTTVILPLGTRELYAEFVGDHRFSASRSPIVQRLVVKR
jgi:hypothetical protein